MHSKFDKPINLQIREVNDTQMHKRKLPEEASWPNFLDSVKGKHFESIHRKNAMCGENTGERES